MTESAPVRRDEAPAPDDVTVADGAGELASAYVHIPFCHRVCPYCDFAVVEGRLDVTSRYVSALV
ncbi:MAG: hypothetical protein GTO46_14730, partial [Gemmatimonadetes bacterium]|nr:hypothetical protein [Gemmatimonadota bacterium]